MGQMRRYRSMTVLAMLLGATVALVACAPFGGATPTAAPSPTATTPPRPTVTATTAPTATVPAATATAAVPATALAPTVAATLAPTNTAVPPALTATAPAPTMPPTTAIPPTLSATVPPPPATAILPTLASVSPTAVAAVGATDTQGRCAVTLPAGFAATGGGSFSGANGRAFITVTALDAGASDTLDDVALPFVGTFTAAVGDYQQTAVARGEDNLRLDFTGRTVAPGRGTIFLRQFGGTVCALSFFLVQGGEVTYDQTVNALLASLRPAEAIGWARPQESGS
jgi:hypothetical protein